MNWYKLIKLIVTVGAPVASAFIKNADSKKTADAIIHLVNTAVDGLANQNPDGTPAATPYIPPVPTDPPTPAE